MKRAMGGRGSKRSEDDASKISPGTEEEYSCGKGAGLRMSVAGKEEEDEAKKAPGFT